MLKKHTISILHAYNGLVWSLKTQPNYKVHLLFSLLAISGCLLLKVSYFEALIVVVTIIFGFVVETINTAIEVATDAIDKNHREDIKIAKDVSAGAMLLYAIGSLIIAGIVFLPKIIPTLLIFEF